MEEKQGTSKAVALKKSDYKVIALSTINTAEDFEKIVDYIANSETYNNNFAINREVEDEHGNKKMVRAVDKNAIATCLMLGSELGFKPMESIMLGRRLNDEAVIKVYRGRDLGLSTIAALQNIYVWKNESGAELVYTGIHVVYKLLTENGVVKRIIDDGTNPFYLYFDMKANEQVDYDPRYHIPMNTGIPIAEIEEALKVKKIPVTRRTTRRGLVELTRGKEVVAIPYTLIQATEAGLYGDGKDIKGKTNWNKHPSAHLIKMSVMAGARMIIGDKLQGALYIAEELPIQESNSVEEIPLDEVD
jgi:hypothetical protein